MARRDQARESKESPSRKTDSSASPSVDRSRAEERVQRFLDTAHELIVEQGSSEFTIQQVVDRSKQSLRGFYQHFDGKDELLFKLFEEIVHDAFGDIREIVEREDDALDRLRVFTIRLHERCDSSALQSSDAQQTAFPIPEFSWQLTLKDPKRVARIMAPISRMLIELIEAAQATGQIQVGDARHATMLVQQTVMCGWLVNRMSGRPENDVTAEAAWLYCLRGLRGLEG